MIWAGVLIASAACYGLLLAALVAIQTFSTGQHLVLDVRVVSLGVAIIAVALRAPFLVVVVAASATAALIRLI